MLETSQYLAGDCLSAADITFAALVSSPPMSTLCIETHSRSSHLSFSASPTKKAISCIHFLQTHGLLKAELCTKNCERRRPGSMFCDYSKRNAILELLFRSRKGLCLDYGDQWYPLRNCNVLLEQKKYEIKR